MNDSAADTDGHGLSPVAGAEFLHDVLDVNFDCFFGDEELVADIAISVAARDFAKHFDFTAGKGLVTIVLSEVSGDLRGNSFFPGMHLANNFYQFLRRHAFEDVSAGSCLEGSLNLNVAGEGGQNDNAGVGEFGADGDHGIDAAHVGQPQVHERDIRVVFAKALKRFAAVGCLGHQREVGLTPNNGGKALMQEWMIIHAENSDLIASVHLCGFSFRPVTCSFRG